MSLISYTTFSIVVGAYLANRALYKYFFNPRRAVLPLSEMLAQYKKKQSITQKFVPKFLRKPQMESLYEFRCNINDKGELDSPVSLHWTPVFTYLDENKESFSFVCSGIYWRKNQRIDVLNMNPLVEYQQNIDNTCG